MKLENDLEAGIRRIRRIVRLSSFCVVCNQQRGEGGREGRAVVVYREAPKQRVVEKDKGVDVRERTISRKLETIEEIATQKIRKDQTQSQNDDRQKSE